MLGANAKTCKSPKLGRSAFKRFVLNIFPVFGWMSQYNVGRDLTADVISGCTVAVMHIPQGECKLFFNQV